MGDVLKAIGKALTKHADQLPTVIRVGEALLKLFKGDDKAAMRAVRRLELQQRKARDRRMGRR